MEELISIIVPVYNAQNYLDRSIQSIINQSYRNLELLLIDDGSTDNSLAICREYEVRDPRVQVFTKENGGVSSARNFGFSKMKGTWFMTMDSDDYMAEDAVRILYESVKKTGADIAVGGLEFVYEDGTPGDRRTWKNKWFGTLEEFGNQLLVPLFDLQVIHNQNNKLYRTDRVVRYDEAMSINEDIWFSVRMLTRSRRVCVVPEVVLYYWQHQAQDSLISRFYDNGVDTCFILLKAMQALLKRCCASNSVKNQINNRMVFHICGFLGLTYYRSGYSRRQCLEEVKKLAIRPEFRWLLADVKPEGAKNTLAVWVLRRRLVRIYHWMCLALYSRQKQKGQKT